MALYKILLVLAFVCVVRAQRPFYAGLSPIGYPDVKSDELSNRFGQSVGPIEARGDGSLINRIRQMPTDSQPFWYLNWRQYEDLRNNPQYYPIRGSSFANRV